MVCIPYSVQMFINTPQIKIEDEFNNKYFRFFTNEWGYAHVISD